MKQYLNQFTKLNSFFTNGRSLENTRMDFGFWYINVIPIEKDQKYIIMIYMNFESFKEKFENSKEIKS